MFVPTSPGVSVLRKPNCPLVQHASVTSPSARVPSSTETSPPNPLPALNVLLKCATTVAMHTFARGLVVAWGLALSWGLGCQRISGFSDLHFADDASAPDESTNTPEPAPHPPDTPDAGRPSPEPNRDAVADGEVPEDAGRPSDVIDAGRSNGSLTGECEAVAPDATAVNLTAVGKLDWLHPGTYQERDVRRSTTSHLIAIDPPTDRPEISNKYAYIFSWSDGDPVANCSECRGGRRQVIQFKPLSVEVLGSESKPRTVSLYVSLDPGTTAEVTAALSDFAADRRTRTMSSQSGDTNPGAWKCAFQFTVGRPQGILSIKLKATQPNTTTVLQAITVH